MSKTNYIPSEVNQSDRTWIQNLIYQLTHLPYTDPPSYHCNIELILETLQRYLTQPHCLIALTGGYSNQTYRSGPFVLRLPKKECPLITDLAAEVHHLQIVHALGFSPLDLQAYSIPQRLLITRYLPGLRTPVDLNQVVHLESLACLVKRLHASQAPFKKMRAPPRFF